MNKPLLLLAIVPLCLVGIVRESQMRARIAELEQRPQTDPAQLARLSQELRDLDLELARTRRGISEDTSGACRDAKLTELEARLGASDEELAAQEQRLSSWSEAWDGHAPEDFQARLRKLRQARAQDRVQLDQLSAAAQSTQEDLARIESQGESVAALVSDRDTDRMWHELVGPVVQISGEITVGSGVLLASQSLEDGSHRTQLITSWHVVRDIYTSTDDLDEPIAVKLYLDDGTTRFEDATLVAHEVSIDIALLELSTTRRISNGARIASRERLDRIQVFDSVYAVGCPLGNDPIPTAGEIADIHHHIDGEHYWMISAPTYIGNSGGGIFDAKTHELLGIFSKIYTHGGARSTIVPHMGLVTPLQAVYDWLDSVDYAQLEVPAESGTLPGVGVQPAGLELR